MRFVQSYFKTFIITNLNLVNESNRAVMFREYVSSTFSFAPIADDYRFETLVSYVGDMRIKTFEVITTSIYTLGSLDVALFSVAQCLIVQINLSTVVLFTFDCKSFKLSSVIFCHLSFLEDIATLSERALWSFWQLHSYAWPTKRMTAAWILNGIDCNRSAKGTSIPIESIIWFVYDLWRFGEKVDLVISGILNLVFDTN